MSTVLAVVELVTIGGDPLDHSHNSFVFDDGTRDPADLAADVAAAVIDFYTDAAYSGSDSLSAYLGAQLSRAADAHHIKWYDITGHLDGTPHGPPFRVGDTFSLSATIGNPLPEGVAICGSYHSAYGSDPEHSGATRPRARDRGRIYLGPLSTFGVSVESSTNRVRVGEGLRNRLAAQMQELAAGDNFPDPGPRWCVWSRRNASVKPIVGGFVDDRFDYQRRREDQGLVRLTWPV